MTFFARSSSGIASWTARNASRPPFQAMTMLSPTGPPRRRSRGGRDHHRRAGFEERPIEHATANGVMRQTFGPGRNHQVDAMGKDHSPSLGFPAGTKIAVSAAACVSSLNIRAYRRFALPPRRPRAPR